jgi:hypothetical protein
MKRILKRSEWIALAALFVAIVFALAYNLGCAAGRGPGGEIVLGFNVAKMVEQTNQAVGQLVDYIVPGLGAAATVLAGSVGYAFKRSGDAKAATAAREAERRGWEEAAATYQPPPPLSKGSA